MYTRCKQKEGENLIDKKAIGKRLTELRGGKTQTEVAKSVGISPSALAMYENGNRIPRDEIKISLAEYYRTTVQKIFFDN